MVAESAMTITATPDEARRTRIEVRGIVQGVGFRPFVYRLAHELALAGWVNNDGAGVTIEVEGDSAQHRRHDAATHPGRASARAHRRHRRTGVRAARRVRLRDPRKRARPCRHGDRARQRDLRRLPRRALRSRRSPLSLRVHQLHSLRPALHDHAIAAVRPRDDQHGRVPAVSRVRGRVSRAGASPLSRRAECMPALRPAAGAGRRRRHSDRRRGSDHRNGRASCVAARSLRSRASADFTWPAMRATATPWPGCGRARRARRSRSRSWRPMSLRCRRSRP